MKTHLTDLQMMYLLESIKTNTTLFAQLFSKNRYIVSKKKVTISKAANVPYEPLIKHVESCSECMQHLWESFNTKEDILSALNKIEIPEVYINQKIHTFSFLPIEGLWSFINQQVPVSTLSKSESEDNVFYTHITSSLVSQHHNYKFIFKTSTKENGISIGISLHNDIKKHSIESIYYQINKKNIEQQYYINNKQELVFFIKNSQRKKVNVHFFYEVANQPYSLCVMKIVL